MWRNTEIGQYSNQQRIGQSKQVTRTYSRQCV
ncbi:hypothetical protein M5D96_012484 [Drosophila gunungcola]|uniref:Uncharacterized protein n=1 Tax=Drosophila gunungcola TaxID=103775 RepID=A0A9P9YD65_9MUSC|nr:hypothetical protein M5D96_012484 [Drosophila gunungcola]